MGDTIKSLLSQMTLKEKASLCSGSDAWHTKQIKRLEVPWAMLSDGPHGVRKNKANGNNIGLDSNLPATCFPTSATSACSWDRELLREIGRALGEECLELGVSVLLGPGVNIKRSPLCGRNFEYFSEDPLLSGELAAAWIEGIQEKGVGACVKHFAANNQEHRRMSIDAVVDERALREIYLPAFETAIRKAKPWMVMCAYNRLNGEYCSENERLLTKILRDEWGFDGVLVTDWGACNDRARGLAAGQDLEMPSSGGINDRRIEQAVKAGKLDEALLDRSARRILNLAFKARANAKADCRCDMETHHALARRAAAESAVLLKNEDSLLPLKNGAKVALIGAFAKTPRYQGSGSSLINPAHLECAWDEIQKYSGNCVFAPGYRPDSGEPDETLIAEACAAARDADFAVVFAGLTEAYESEGFDREHMRMPEAHNALIGRVAAANPHTSVVLLKGAPVEMPWIGSVQAVLDCYLGGEAGGSAAADLLFGAANPCGKLAETIPLKLEDTLSSRYFPAGPDTVEYRESLYVGYRWFDSAKIPVRFPFGHGLSYTSFVYSDLELNEQTIRSTDGLTASLTVRNAGPVAGAEIVQLYVHGASGTVFRPEKELKGFEKVRLEPGERKTVTITLEGRAFACYDRALGDWKSESGEYEILIGASSADIRLRQAVRLETGEPSASAPHLRETAAVYFNPSEAANGIPDEAFEALCGGRHQGNAERNEKFTLNSTMDDVRATFIGRRLYGLVYSVSKGMLKAGDSEAGRKVTERFVAYTPLRFVVTMSEGKFPHWLMKFLLALMNLKRK